MHCRAWTRPNPSWEPQGEATRGAGAAGEAGSTSPQKAVVLLLAWHYCSDAVVARLCGYIHNMAGMVYQ
jgi:hypothetical protein